LAILLKGVSMEFKELVGKQWRRLKELEQKGRINPKVERPTRFDDYKVVGRSFDRFLDWLKCG
jgi:hypothetical protein